MSDKPTVTEREVVLRERKAYVAGWRDVNRLDGDMAATRLYPLPSITRPRVVKDPAYPSYEWRVVDGLLEWRRDPYSSGWVSIETAGGFIGIYAATKQRVAVWADLLSNPTEEVTE